MHFFLFRQETIPLHFGKLGLDALKFTPKFAKIIFYKRRIVIYLSLFCLLNDMKASCFGRIFSDLIRLCSYNMLILLKIINIIN